MGDDGGMSSRAVVLGWIADRRSVVSERLAGVEARLDAVRTARGDWIDEEHDPEGFALTFEWQQAEGLRTEHLAELAELDAAEERVVAGAFGVCEVCGQPIPEGRLEVRPDATRCVRHAA